MRVAIAGIAWACAAAACGSSSTSAPTAASGSGTDGGAARSALGGSALGGTAPRMHMITPDLRSLPAPAIHLPFTESFRLVDAGAAPRARLRYRFDPGNHEVDVDAALTTRRLAGAVWGDQASVPRLREGFGVIATPDPAGGAQLAFRGATAAIVDKGQAAGDAKARADEYLAEFRDRILDRRGTIAIDDRGRIGAIAFLDVGATAPPKSAKADAPDRAVDDVAARWLAATVPLPDEPVGKGAHWRVITALREGAAVVKQTADYTLVEARADRWIVEEAVRRIGQEQAVDGNLPDGATAELLALFRDTHGKVEVSPALPWPIAGSLDTELRVHVRIDVPAQGAHDDLTEDLGTLTFSSK